MSSEIKKFKTEIRQTFPSDNLEASLRNDPGCMELGDCIWTMVDTAIVEDILIGPNCKARVHYDLVICEVASDPSNIILQFSFDNFEAYPIEGECDSIINSWLNLYQMDDTIALENDIRDFNYFVSDLVEHAVIEEFLIDFQWGPWFDCSSFNTFLFADFSLVECSQLWIRFV